MQTLHFYNFFAKVNKLQNFPCSAHPGLARTATYPTSEREWDTAQSLQMLAPVPWEISVFLFLASNISTPPTFGGGGKESIIKIHGVLRTHCQVQGLGEGLSGCYPAWIVLHL